MTTNNVLGCEIVLMSGETLRIGGKAAENSGYDLMGIITGSEGLLGVITEITVRILQKPETARALMVGFSEVEAAGECVARIIGAGIIPGGMEMMEDRKSTRLNSSHANISYAVFCLKKKKTHRARVPDANTQRVGHAIPQAARGA